MGEQRAPFEPLPATSPVAAPPEGGALEAPLVQDVSTEADWAPPRRSSPPVRVLRTTLRPGAPPSDLTEPPRMSAPAGTPPAPRATRSSLPPSLVERSRIIEVLGSTVPISPLPGGPPSDIDELQDHEALPTSLPPVTVSIPPVSIPLAPPSGVTSEGEPPRPLGRGALPPQRKPRAPGRGGVSGPVPDLPKPARLPEVGDSTDEAARADIDATGDSSPPVDGEPRRRWWEELFSGEFLRAIPILSPAQLEREVRFIQKSLSLPKGSRVLDLACGAGQHAVELAARGYDVVGFDQSQSQLNWAGELARERTQVVRFQYGDMRDLAYDAEFDGIYCWNTSFGYFEEERNVDIARRMLRALKPGGRLLLDVVNRDYVFPQQPSQNWFEGDGCVCIDDVRADFITSRLRVKRTLMLTSGKNCECNFSLRLYSLHELGRLLHEVGFRVLQATGRTEIPGVFLGADSPRVIMLASRPRQNGGSNSSEPPRPES